MKDVSFFSLTCEKQEYEETLHYWCLVEEDCKYYRITYDYRFKTNQQIFITVFKVIQDSFIEPVMEFIWTEV